MNKDSIYDHVLERFYEMLTLHGDSIAAHDRGEDFTYRQLHGISNAVAKRLREIGAQPGDAIGIYAGRKVEFLLAVLGILKAGCFYVPLGDEEGKERMDYFLQDSSISIICLCSQDKHQLFSQRSKLLLITTEEEKEESFPLDLSQKLVYRMYTSGTTGFPKGCDISHENLLNFVFGQDFCTWKDSFTVLHIGSPTFDACTFELWYPLLWGGKIVFLPKEDVVDPEAFRRAIHDHAITHLLITASLFHQMCDLDPAIFLGLHSLMIAGSVVSVRALNLLRPVCAGVELYNVYGPTENTVLTTFHKIQKEDLNKDSIPIGKALNHVKLIVVDEELRLCKQGEQGELCIAGKSLTSGYHHREELNESRFFYHEGERYYRSGDEVVEIERGVYDFRGRKDRQLKMKGFRVEIEEIERSLEKVPGIQEILLMPEKKGDNYLLSAYYRSEDFLLKEELLYEASQRIAQYMMPNHWIRLPYLPLNINGKVDQSKILEMERDIEEIYVKMKSTFELHGKTSLQRDTKVVEIPLSVHEVSSLLSTFNLDFQKINPKMQLFSLAEVSYAQNTKQLSSKEDADLFVEILGELADA